MAGATTVLCRNRRLRNHEEFHQSVFFVVICCLSGCCWFSTVNTMAYGVNRKSCSSYEHCHSSPDGVHDLDCFWIWKSRMKCTWKSGRWSSRNAIYTFIHEQSRKLGPYRPNHQNTSNTFIDFVVYKADKLNACVIDASHIEMNCTMTTFSGIPQNLSRCHPRNNIDFKRYSRQLDITPSWEEAHVKDYVVRIREMGGKFWRMLQPVSKGVNSIAANLTSSKSYEIQVQCVTSDQCSQCPWSQIITVPPELTDNPTVNNLEVSPYEKGKRLIIIHWKLEGYHSADGYNVTVAKESREFQQVLFTSESSLRLLLSDSAYVISIVAFNQAGASPPVTTSVQTADDAGFFGTLNITFNGNMSFVVAWDIDLSPTYHCFSVDWWLMGEKPSWKSFYLKKGRHKEITLKAPLQPYKKYFFLLNARPDKNTCNLKHVNNSEATYGRTQQYALEGTPVSAPANITSLNATSSSLVVQWSPIAEEDLRGFLLGYRIYYSENKQENQSIVVQVGHTEHSHVLSGLKQQTVYMLRMSVFTAAGEGVQSDPVYFKTKPPDLSADRLAGLITVVLLFLCVPVFSRLFKRVKVVFWPSIPNPGNSNAVQKIDGAHSLDILESMGHGRLAHVKESNMSSLHIIEHEASPQPSCRSPLMAEEMAGPGAAEEEGQAASGDIESPAATPPSARPAQPCPGDYTTMELFQQMTTQSVLDGASPVGKPGGACHTKPDHDYIQQAICLSIMWYHESSDKVEISIL
uniref:Protein sidekick-2-like n=1 Tax=Paramormyrops kingsleyae TaxID=1676925 RepID=A0A3B3R0B9_9TELE|nr:leukemia inhibitory factor receptor-like isoform X1 [Paramormyrops kingsleyae]XP_023652580.1 leukemia inhibitory factor receptor-like isoform X1 [Paramormyrops kingsleyae]XP_023652586.1 leukemia inhibitory factor receptor-like isoform X1 [Paramormyrops kingsleyae]